MSCKWILKVLMVIFNSAIFIAGAVTVIIGFLVEINKKTVLGALFNSEDIPQEFAPLLNAGYLLIALGVVLAFMGFLGCYGACCDNKCMLVTFFIITFIVFVAEMVAAVLLLLSRPKAEKLLSNLRDKVTQSIKKNYGRNDIISKAWNETMSLMKCCGYNNYTDFTGTQHVNSTSSLYPPSCCSETKDKCYHGQAESKPVIGCFDALVKWVKSNSSLLGAVAVSVIAIEIVAMIVSLILYKE